MQDGYKKLRLLLEASAVDPWASDEVHFQQHGSGCRMWIPREDTNPILLHHPTRKGVGCFGAVRPRDGKFVLRMHQNKFNEDSFWAFLRKLWRSSWHAGRQVVVIADNASYHHSKMHRP